MSSDQSNNLTNLLSKDVTKISREAPMNIGAEQALLGAILSNNLALEKVENFLEPEHFSSKINSIIFVNGCFWHSHNCKTGNKKPKSNKILTVSLSETLNPVTL